MQQEGAATARTNSDLSRPAKTSDLRQRPSATILRLVCIQKARGSSPLSSTRRGGAPGLQQQMRRIVAALVAGMNAGAARADQSNA